MPIFEYRCDECNLKFEEFRSLSNTKPVQCPNCESEQTSKLFSTFASCGVGDLTNIGSGSSGCGSGSFTWGV